MFVGEQVQRGGAGSTTQVQQPFKFDHVARQGLLSGCIHAHEEGGWSTKCTLCMRCSKHKFQWSAAAQMGCNTWNADATRGAVSLPSRGGPPPSPFGLPSDEGGSTKSAKLPRPSEGVVPQLAEDADAGLTCTIVPPLMELEPCTASAVAGADCCAAGACCCAPPLTAGRGMNPASCAHGPRSCRQEGH